MVSNMDKTDPDSWFTFEFNANSAVADYANQPPRGMTNPPMNLPLREVLCKDLVEYGLDLEVPQWGTGFVRTSSSTPTSPSQTQLFPPRRLTRGAQTRSQLMHSYSENLRQGRVLKSGSIFSRSAPNLSVVSAEESAPAHPPWHGYHPFPHTLRPIDGRGPVSLASPSKSQASSAEKEKRTVRFVDSPKSLADCLTQGGSPQNTEFIKTPSHDKAIKLGQKMNLNDPSGKRPSEKVPVAKQPKESSKDGAKDEDDNANHPAVIDNTALDNSMRVMRGMSQLHRAAVADRYRFGASAAQGEPMVLRASPLSQACPGVWSSDAAFLNKFHNSSIRIVNPSGLEVLKEPKPKKKKKKKAAEDDEEELKMSDSGLFVARYPIDGALVKMRRIRKQAFPEEDEDKKPKGPSQEEIAAQAAAKLKLDLGGFMLARVREDGADKAEQDEALAKSGY